MMFGNDGSNSFGATIGGPPSFGVYSSFNQPSAHYHYQSSIPQGHYPYPQNYHHHYGQYSSPTHSVGNYPASVPYQSMLNIPPATPPTTAPFNPTLDMLWARVIQRIATSSLAYDPNMFADMSALIIQTFGTDSESYRGLVEWAQSYGHASQYQMIMNGMAAQESVEDEYLPPEMTDQRIAGGYRGDMQVPPMANGTPSYSPFIAGRNHK